MRVAVLLPWIAVAASASAQDQSHGGTVCDGKRVEAITIRSSAPTAARLERIRVVGTVVRTFHVTTRPELIQRFLLIEPGGMCTEVERAESERILRALPFLADAEITVVPHGDDAVMLEVRTVDEASLVISGRAVSALPPVRSLRFGNGNLNGSGVYLAGRWMDGQGLRHGFGARYINPLALGRPYTLSLEANRYPIGDDAFAEFARPFRSDLQRVAWRASIGHVDDVVRFGLSNDSLFHGLRLERYFWDAGAIARIGPPGRMGLVGLSVTHDQERPGQDPMLVSDRFMGPDADSTLVGRFAGHEATRANVLLGVRGIRFVRVRGFDALTAAQDLPVGFQLGTQIGRTLPALAGHPDDTYLAGDVYFGLAREDAAFRVQFQAEGRRPSATGRWDDILTSGRAAQYVRFSGWHTTMLVLDWSAGWRYRAPFVLTLADRLGGLRGHRDAHTPGGQRLVARLEDRRVLGRVLDYGDLGLAWFLDAGRLWGGDVPFGEDTPVRSSLGVSLLASVPAGSPRLWRLDFALAQRRESGGGQFEVRLSTSDATRYFFREPEDVRTIRRRTVPSSIFSWP